MHDFLRDCSVAALFALRLEPNGATARRCSLYVLYVRWYASGSSLGTSCEILMTYAPIWAILMKLNARHAKLGGLLKQNHVPPFIPRRAFVVRSLGAAHNSYGVC